MMIYNYEQTQLGRIVQYLECPWFIMFLLSLLTLSDERSYPTLAFTHLIAYLESRCPPPKRINRSKNISEIGVDLPLKRYTIMPHCHIPMSLLLLCIIHTQFAKYMYMQGKKARRRIFLTTFLPNTQFCPAKSGLFPRLTDITAL